MSNMFLIIVIPNIQCTPDISRSCISRNRIYRGRMLDPIFWPPISLISRTWRDFSRNRSNSLDPFARDSFSRNLLTAVAFDPARRRQFSAKSALAYLWNVDGNTCCAMASHGRRIIDPSIVSQSRVLLILCPCKSMPQTTNQGKTNAFLIKSSLTTCWHPPFCEDGQVHSKSSTRAWLVDIPLVAMHTKIRIISWRKMVKYDHQTMK